ncbi:hypothetical protein BREVUG8_110740 [Brevundimonas sp. G8]|nr:hypothetical protein BREVUG8_110740 [Brevundimonas sp. G8]
MSPDTPAPRTLTLSPFARSASSSCTGRASAAGNPKPAVMESPKRVTIFSGAPEGTVVGGAEAEGVSGESGASSFEGLHPASTSPSPPVRSVRRGIGGMGEEGVGVMICAPI